MTTRAIEEGSTGIEAYRVASVSTELEALEDLSRQLIGGVHSIAVHTAMVRCIGGTGVVMFPDFHRLPTIMNSEGAPIPLFEFVDVLDSAADYDEIASTLQVTYTQINGAMTFLRRMSTVNPEGFDVEQYELDLAADDGELIDALRRGIRDQDGIRVLDGK